MQKNYRLENLDCANCAAKIEAKFNAHPEVEEAVIVFPTRQLRLRAQDPDSLIPALQDLARTVEAGIEIHPWETPSHHPHSAHCSCHTHEHHGHGHCECHEHEHHHEQGHTHCDCHNHEHAHCQGAEHHHDLGGDRHGFPWDLIIGAALFVLGLLFGKVPYLPLVLLIGAYLILGWRVLFTAGRNLFKGHVFDENFLMSLATLGAFAIGEAPEAVGVMLFYRIGEFFEDRAVEKSRSQIMEAVDLRPETVNLVDGGTIRFIPAAEAKVGDLLVVRPGDRIPLDGSVVSGESRLDTSSVTGEPVPVRVTEGDAVISGCVNTTGRLVIRVEKILAESMVTRILNCVENAAASKPKIDRFITRFARIYTPIVVILAALVAVVPSLITKDWDYWVYTALSFLVMSCPCALVLSVPLAFFSGIGAGSKQGILFKGGLSMEAMGKIRAVVLDKTGTLTKGDFKVQHLEGDPRLLMLAAGCEQNSTHPIALSILDAARQQQLPIPEAVQLEELPGLGIRAQIDGKTVLCGNEKLLTHFHISVPALPEAEGTRVLIAEDNICIGYLVIADTLKEDAAKAISRLNRMDLTTVMLTGDGEIPARRMADRLGINNLHARLLPEEKLRHMQDIRADLGAVMYVGDGINDAPVLAGSDVGAAMGTGADAAIEAADVVFMTSRVDAIPTSIAIARKTTRIAWQNLWFALAVKAIVMVLGLCGFASMWLAVFADSGVAMLCVLNAIRLLYHK